MVEVCSKAPRIELFTLEREVTAAAQQANHPGQPAESESTQNAKTPEIKTSRPEPRIRTSESELQNQNHRKLSESELQNQNFRIRTQ
jgi:hypothetical protein